MAENTAEKKETIEAPPPEVSKEEVASAAEVMLSVVKTSKAFRMYLANNPLLHRFLDDLMARLTSHIGKYGELKLDIDQFELKCKGKTVYESRDPKESLAFKMYSDGIRSLIFSEGIEGKEVTDFLEIIGKDRPSEVDDEIEWLKTAKELDEGRNALDEVVQVLFSILSVEKDFTVFGEFIDITVNLIGNLLHSGDIMYAVSLISFLRELSQNEKLSPEHKDRLLKGPGGAVSGV